MGCKCSTASEGDCLKESVGLGPSSLFGWLRCSGCAGLSSVGFLFLFAPALGVTALDLLAALDGDTTMISSSSNPSRYGRTITFFGVVTISLPAVFDTGGFTPPALAFFVRFLTRSVSSNKSRFRNSISVATLSFSARAFSISTLWRAASPAWIFCNSDDFFSYSLTILTWFALMIAISPALDKAFELAVSSSCCRVSRSRTSCQRKVSTHNALCE